MCSFAFAPRDADSAEYPSEGPLESVRKLESVSFCAALKVQPSILTDPPRFLCIVPAVPRLFAHHLGLEPPSPNLWRNGIYTTGTGVES